MSIFSQNQHRFQTKIMKNVNGKLTLILKSFYEIVKTKFAHSLLFVSALMDHSVLLYFLNHYLHL